MSQTYPDYWRPSRDLQSDEHLRRDSTGYKARREACNEVPPHVDYQLCHDWIRENFHEVASGLPGGGGHDCPRNISRPGSCNYRHLMPDDEYVRRHLPGFVASLQVRHVDSTESTHDAAPATGIGARLLTSFEASTGHEGDGEGFEVPSEIDSDTEYVPSTHGRSPSRIGVKDRTCDVSLREDKKKKADPGDAYENISQSTRYKRKGRINSIESLWPGLTSSEYLPRGLLPKELMEGAFMKRATDWDTRIIVKLERLAGLTPSRLDAAHEYMANACKRMNVCLDDDQPQLDTVLKVLGEAYAIGRAKQISPGSLQHHDKRQDEPVLASDHAIVTPPAQKAKTSMQFTEADSNSHTLTKRPSEPTHVYRQNEHWNGTHQHQSASLQHYGLPTIQPQLVGVGAPVTRRQVLCPDPVSMLRPNNNINVGMPSSLDGMWPPVRLKQSARSHRKPFCTQWARFGNCAFMNKPGGCRYPHTPFPDRATFREELPPVEDPPNRLGEYKRVHGHHPPDTLAEDWHGEERTPNHTAQTQIDAIIAHASRPSHELPPRPVAAAGIPPHKGTDKTPSRDPTQVQSASTRGTSSSNVSFYLGFNHDRQDRSMQSAERTASVDRHGNGEQDSKPRRLPDAEHLSTEQYQVDAKALITPPGSHQGQKRRREEQEIGDETPSNSVYAAQPALSEERDSPTYRSIKHEPGQSDSSSLLDITAPAPKVPPAHPNNQRVRVERELKKLRLELKIHEKEDEQRRKNGLDPDHPLEIE